MKNHLKILVILFVILVSGCAKKDENKLKFWHFWSEPNQKKVIEQLIKQFETENSCKVEISELSWNDGKTKYYAAFNSKTAPDVLELGSDWIAQFSSSNVLLELNKDSMNTDKFIEFSKEPAIWKGKFYALPWIVDTRVLFYNKDLMKQAGLDSVPPDNFYDLLTMCEKIKQIDGKYGFGANGSDQHRLYKKIIPMFWSNGGDIFDKNGKLVIYSPENVAALNMYLNLSRTGFIESQKQIDASFVEGNIGFWFSGGWLLEKIKNENPNLNFGVAQLPGLSIKPGISFAGGEYLAINSNSKKIDLAKKFIKFMTDGKNSIQFCKQIIEAGFPADKNYFNDVFYQSTPNRLVFSNQLSHARMTPVHPKWLEIESIIENSTVEALYGKSSAENALYNAYLQITEKINKN